MIELVKSLLFKAFKKTTLKDEHCWLLSSAIVSLLYLILIPHLTKILTINNGLLLFLLDLVFSEQLKRMSTQDKNILRFAFLFVLLSFLLDSYILRCISLGFLIFNASSPYQIKSTTHNMSFLVLLSTVVFYQYGFGETFDKYYVEWLFTFSLLIMLTRNCLKREQTFQSLILATLMIEGYFNFKINHHPELFLIPILAVVYKMMSKIEYENMTRNTYLLISRKQLVWISLFVSIYFLDLNVFVFTLAICIVAKELTNSIIKIYAGIILGQYILISSMLKITEFNFSSLTLFMTLTFILYLLLTQKIEKIRSSSIVLSEIQIPVAIVIIFSYFLLYVMLPTTVSVLGLASLVLTISLATGTSLIFVARSTKGFGRRYLPFIPEVSPQNHSISLDYAPELIAQFKSVLIVLISFFHSLLEEVEIKINGLHLFIFCSLLMFAFWATRMGM